MSKTGQRPPIPTPLRRLILAVAAGHCVECGYSDPPDAPYASKLLRVAHLDDQVAVRAHLDAEECSAHDHFQQQRSQFFKQAFHRIGNLAYLCATCETLCDNVPTVRARVELAMHKRLHEGTAKGYVGQYFYNCLARLDTPFTSDEDVWSCLHFLGAEYNAKRLDLPVEFVILPIGGPPAERAGRFHFHVRLGEPGFSACAGDHSSCANSLPVMRSGGIYAP